MRRVVAVAVCAAVLAACSSGDGDGASETTTATTVPVTEEVGGEAPATTDAPAEAGWRVGAASRSILPTVDGSHDYLADAPGWGQVDPIDPGVFVPEWDQGSVDVGNGSDDGSWVHDDLRVTAVAFDNGEDVLVMTSADVYMIFAADAAEIERQAMALLEASDPELAARTQIIISSTHNHHGPDTAFSINDDWYALMADQTAQAIVEAVGGLRPAIMSVGSGDHHFGVSDGRDPLIIDTGLKVLSAVSTEDASIIATIVQWGSHPETTLNWSPPADIAEACATKGWEGDDCTAEGRYFTADYPGVMRERIQETIGGEVLYFNGAIGTQIGPGDADVWQIDDDHPATADGVAPAGAQPVTGAADLRERNLARTEAIGSALATAALHVAASGAVVDDTTMSWIEQPFYTRLSNIGFRVLLADGSLGWQTPAAYLCDAKPFTDDNCVDDGGRLVDDPVLTPLIEGQIREGDVLKTRVAFATVAGIGFLFMPGELPPELVIGLPDDFAADTAKYYEHPDLHATGDAYAIPGALLDLVPTDITFTIGLGGDELGYFVPINEVRLKCLDLVFTPESGYTCQRLFDEGLLVTPDAVGGPACRALTDGEANSYTPEQATALTAVCRYGQALGRELGEPDDHYEETNSAGWDLVDDLWAAASAMFGR